MTKIPVWHIGRSSGVGFFAGVCSSLCAAVVCSWALHEPQLHPKTAHGVPGWILAIGMMVGPLAGMLMHGIYRLIDRLDAGKEPAAVDPGLE